MPALSSLPKLVIVLLTVMGITHAGTPDPKGPQVVISAKFVQITAGPAGGVPLPAFLDVARKVPGILGTLTDAEFQAVIRALSQRKGVDLLVAPNLMTRLGQEAKTEVTRKFEYTDEAGKPATADLGVALTVLAKMQGGGQIHLDLSPEIVDCDGFTEHASGWAEPAFSVSQAKLGVVMKPGETVVLEMEPKTDKQVVQEADAAGQIISSETELRHRRTLVFITANLIAPAASKPTR